MHSLLHVLVRVDYPEGAYADPCQSYTFVPLILILIYLGFKCLIMQNLLDHTAEFVFRMNRCFNFQKCNYSKTASVV
jgi:hypothetical protein